jgi:endonuclease/exonuclease/phosphatase (EEP) superfamily protein YafD
MLFLLRLLRVGVGLAVLGVATCAILGFFGFVAPGLDLFNHLQVPLFAATMIGFILSWGVFGKGRWRAALIGWATLGLIASAAIFGPEAVAAFVPRPPLPTDGRQVIRVMTHNIFGLNYDMKRVAAVVAAENPDIIALQEFFPFQRQRLDPLLKPSYPYSVHCVGGKRAFIGLYSKFPFTEEVTGACEANAAKGERIARILGKFTLPDGTKFSLMTTHLDWPATRADLFSTVTRQGGEFDDLEKAVAETSGPMILVGDFNSTSWSYALRGFAEKAGLTRQDHNVLTWPALFYIDEWRKTPPFLSLDHVMTRGLDVHSLHAAPTTGSDHIPLVFTFSVPKGAEL